MESENSVYAANTDVEPPFLKNTDNTTAAADHEAVAYMDALAASFKNNKHAVRSSEQNAVASVFGNGNGPTNVENSLQPKQFPAVALLPNPLPPLPVLSLPPPPPPVPNRVRRPPPPPPPAPTRRARQQINNNYADQSNFIKQEQSCSRVNPSVPGGLLPPPPSEANFTDPSEKYAWSSAPVVATTGYGALSFINSELQQQQHGARRCAPRQPLLPDYNNNVENNGHDAFDFSDLVPSIAHRYFEVGGCDPPPTDVLVASQDCNHAAGQGLLNSPPPPPPPCLSFNAASAALDDHGHFAGGRRVKDGREYHQTDNNFAGRNVASARETEMEISTPSMGSAGNTPREEEMLAKESSEPDLKRKFREAGLESDWSRLFASNADQCRSANDADSIARSNTTLQDQQQQHKSTSIIALHNGAPVATNAAEHATDKTRGNGKAPELLPSDIVEKAPKSEGEISSECIAPSELNAKPFLASHSSNQRALQDFVHRILSETERKSLPPADSAPLRPVRTVVRDKKSSSRDERNSHNSTKVLYALDDILRVSNVGSEECFKKLIVIRGPNRSYKTAVAQRIEDDFKRRVNTRPPKHLAEFSSRIVSAEDMDARFYTQGGVCSSDEKTALLADCDNNNESRVRKSPVQDEEARCRTGDRAAFMVTCLMKYYNVRRINYLIILEGRFEYADELQKMMLELLKPYKDVEAFIVDLGAELEHHNVRGNRNDRHCSWRPESLKNWVFLRSLMLEQSWLEHIVKDCDKADKEAAERRRRTPRIENVVCVEIPASEEPANEPATANGNLTQHNNTNYHDEPVDGNQQFSLFPPKAAPAVVGLLIAPTVEHGSDRMRHASSFKLSPRFADAAVYSINPVVRSPLLHAAPPPPLLPLLPYPKYQSEIPLHAGGNQQLLFGEPREFAASPRRQASSSPVGNIMSQRQQLLIDVLASQRKHTTIDESKKLPIVDIAISSPVKSLREISDYGYRRGTEPQSSSKEDLSITRRDSSSSSLPRHRSDSYAKRAAAADSYASLSGNNNRRVAAAERRPRDRRDSMSPISTTPVMQYDDDFDDDFSRVPLNAANMSGSAFEPRQTSPVDRRRQENNFSSIPMGSLTYVRSIEANKKGPPAPVEIQRDARSRRQNDINRQKPPPPVRLSDRDNDGSRYSACTASRGPPVFPVRNSEQQQQSELHHQMPLHAVVKTENNEKTIPPPPIIAVKTVKTEPDDAEPQQSLADMVNSIICAPPPERKSILSVPIKRKTPAKNYVIDMAKKFKDNSEKLIPEPHASTTTSSAALPAVGNTSPTRKINKVTFPGLAPLKPPPATENALSNNKTSPTKEAVGTSTAPLLSASATDFKTSLYKLLSSVHDDGLLSAQSLERMKKKAEMLAVEATAAVASPDAEADHSEYALEKSSKKLMRKRDKLKKWQDEDNNKLSPNAAAAAAAAKPDVKDSAVKEVKKDSNAAVDAKPAVTGSNKSDDDDDAELIIKRKKSASITVPIPGSSTKPSESTKKSARKRRSSSSSSSSSASILSSPALSPPSIFKQPTKPPDLMPPPRNVAKFHTLPSTLSLTLPSSVSKFTNLLDNSDGQQMVTCISDKLRFPVFDALETASSKLKPSEDLLLFMHLPHFSLANFGIESVRHFRCVTKDSGSSPERIALSRGGFRRQYWRSLIPNETAGLKITDNAAHESLNVTEFSSNTSLDNRVEEDAVISNGEIS